MRALALALALACLAGAPRAVAQPAVPGSDLVTPAGRVFRDFAAGPLDRADRSRGLRLTYAAEDRDRAALVRDAEALVAAVGPELATSGQTVLVVGPGGGRGGEGVAFELRVGQWQRTPPSPPTSAPPPVASAEDRTAVARTSGAAAAASRWLTHLDQARPREAVAAAATSFRLEIQATDQWRALLDRRQAPHGPAQRDELYRFQALGGSARDAWVVTVQYRTRSTDGARFLERVTLLEEGGGWKVAGYGVRAETAAPTGP